jgi:hypothetical protein
MADGGPRAAPDYRPVLLSRWCNAGQDVLPRPAPVGRLTMRGLPFVIGDPDAPDSPPFIVVRAGGDGVTVPIGQTAYSIVVAHRQLERVEADGAGAGTPVARYVFTLRGGRRIESEIRERFEVHTIGSEGWSQDSPFLAASDLAAEPFDRTRGSWEWTGVRQTEVRTGLPQAFYLWAWINPEPSEPVESLEVVPLAGRVLVAGVTLGHVEEHPLSRSRGRPVGM